MHKLKERIKSDKGFVAAFTMMLFLVLTISLSALTIKVVGNNRGVGAVISKDKSYHYAEYGLNKAKSKIDEYISNDVTDSKKLEYSNGSTGKKKFVKDVNDKVLDDLFDYDEIKDNKDLMDLDVEIREEGSGFTLSSKATVKDSTKALNFTRKLEAGADYVVAFEMPVVDSAVTSENPPDFSSAYIKGKSYILKPDKRNRINLGWGFKGFKESIKIVDGEKFITNPVVYLASHDIDGNRITADNVKEYFSFEGKLGENNLNGVTGLAKHLFEIEGPGNNPRATVPKIVKNSNNEPYKAIQILPDNYKLPEVASLKDYSHITSKADPYVIPYKSDGGYQAVKADGSLMMPANDFWKFKDDKNIVYEFSKDAYYPEISTPTDWVGYTFDVGDKDIEVVTDKINLKGHITIKGTGSLTIFVTDKYMTTLQSTKKNIQVLPTRVHAHDEDGNIDNKKLVIAFDTPDSWEKLDANGVNIGTKLPLNIGGGGRTPVSMSIIAKYLDASVAGDANINILSHGKDSFVEVRNSVGLFSSRLFYLKEGKIRFVGGYYNGSVIAKNVEIPNAGAGTIENNEYDNPNFSGFPLEIDFDGYPSSGSSTLSKLNFDTTREVD